jgi:hypothetical protein
MTKLAIPPQTPVSGELLPAKGKNGRRRRGALPGQWGVPPKPVTKENWPVLIGHIASGVNVPRALQEANISRNALEGVLRTDPAKKQEYEDAKTAALWQHWDVDTIEHIMASIAMGSTVRAAIASFNNEWDDTPGNREYMFYRLLVRDETIKEMYDEARMIQAEKMAIDDLIEIADESENDETWDGKPNSAAVNRARLKVDARKWVAAKMHFKRFGDKLEQNLNANIVVDHAARLEEARKRKEALNKAREKADGKAR